MLSHHLRRWRLERHPTLRLQWQEIGSYVAAELSLRTRFTVRLCSQVELLAGSRSIKLRMSSTLGRCRGFAALLTSYTPNISMIEIRRRPGGKKCKMFLESTDFDRNRYEQARSPLVTVTGRPRFKIGTERRSFDEFEVTRIDFIEEEDFSLAV
jgi:hypothetical protein